MTETFIYLRKSLSKFYKNKTVFLNSQILEHVLNLAHRLNNTLLDFFNLFTTNVECIDLNPKKITYHTHKIIRPNKCSATVASAAMPY